MPPSKDDLLQRWKPKIQSKLHREGKDPEIRPTVRWLRDHELYSPIRNYRLEHDLTPQEVLEDEMGFTPRERDDLGIRDDKCRELIEQWLQDEQELHNKWGDRRITDARCHIRKWASCCSDVYGTTNLLYLFDPPDELPDLTRLRRVTRRLSEDISSQARANYTRTLDRWASRLESDSLIEDNYVSDLRDKLGDRTVRPNTSPEHTLNLRQVRTLWEHVETPEEMTLFVLWSTSGVRRADPVPVKIEDIRLNSSMPKIYYPERKNGPATVPILAGKDVIKARVRQLQKEYDDPTWLFPSDQSESGHRTDVWASNQFSNIVERADVTFPDGQTPTPKDLRSFWYKIYHKAENQYYNELKPGAKAQGSSSLRVIDGYTEEERKERAIRRHASDHLRFVYEDVDQRIEEVFDHDDSNQTSFDSFAGDPLSVWTRRRLQEEHTALATSDRFDYPLSRSKTAALGGLLFIWAVGFGVFFGLTETLIFNPVSNNLQADPALVSGLAIGFAMVVRDVLNLNPI